MPTPEFAVVGGRGYAAARRFAGHGSHAGAIDLQRLTWHGTGITVKQLIGLERLLPAWAQCAPDNSMRAL